MVASKSAEERHHPEWSNVSTEQRLVLKKLLILTCFRYTTKYSSDGLPTRYQVCHLKMCRWRCFVMARRKH